VFFRISAPTDVWQTRVRGMRTRTAPMTNARASTHRSGGGLECGKARAVPMNRRGTKNLSTAGAPTHSHSMTVSHPGQRTPIVCTIACALRANESRRRLHSRVQRVRSLG
jgi:hypothetical protein